MKNRAAKRIAVIFTTLAVLIPCAFALSACAQSVSVRFTVQTLDLYVGESRDLFGYAVFAPFSADDKTFTLSSDDDCITIDGTVVTAVKQGNAVVTATASGGSSSVAVSVKYLEPYALQVEYSGDIIQSAANVSAITPITFSAITQDYLSPDLNVLWTVNGVTAATGDEFTFLPVNYGEFNVTATADSVQVQTTIKIYRPTAAYGSAVGEFEQVKNFTPIKFMATDTLNTQNPPTTYDWRVNDRSQSEMPVFELIPSGQSYYKVELYVNGVRRMINGTAEIEIICKGDRAPVPNAVTFDDSYGVFIEWADGGAITSVTVITPDNVRTTYARADVVYGERFYNGKFDASGIIDVCADVPGEYTVSLYAGARGESFTFRQYPEAAERYLHNTVLARNSFLSDERDLTLWIYELFATETQHAEAYIARGFDVETVDLSSITAYCGVDFLLTMQDSATVRIEFESAFDSVPSYAATSEAGQIYIEPPHIDYDSTRPQNYVFAIDRKPDFNRKIESSEQLYAVVRNGNNPAQLSGTAQLVYLRAQRILRSIIGTEYTDKEKVHAIYDWLQWATKKTDVFVSSCSASYLEGTFIDGVVNDLGLSKAFAFMCGIEGIDVETMYDAKTQRFFNRARIDGLLYNVDAYHSEVLIGNREVSCHSGLFVTDEMLNLSDACAESRALMFSLQKEYSDGVYTDRHIAAEEIANLDELKIQISAIIEAVFARQNAGTIFIESIEGTAQYTNNFYGIELTLDGKIEEDTVQRVLAVISNCAAAATGVSASRVQIIVADNSIFVTVRIPA